MTAKLAAQNGTLVKLAPGLHADQGFFVTRSGHCLTLRKTNPLLVERLANTQQGKPDVPMIEVTAPGGKKRVERAYIPDVDKLTPAQREKLDPAVMTYLTEMNAWQREKHVRLLVYLFSAGVTEDPPTEFLAEYRQYLPGETDAMYKYLWIGTLLDEGGVDGGEALELMSATMGLTVPTEGGLADAANGFRSDDQRQPAE